MTILDKIIAQARQDPRPIVFPETEDHRVVEAVKRIAKEGIAKPILIGSTEKLSKLFDGRALSRIQIIEPNKEMIETLAIRLVKIRAEKKIILDEAKKELSDPMHLACMLVVSGKAEGVVSGAAHPTSHTLKPAFQIIGTEEKNGKASSFFIMERNDSIYFFADCAVNPNPSAEELAMIAIDTAESCRFFGIEPIVAILSFSTYGSASHPLAIKAHQGAMIAKEKSVKIGKKTIIDGEMQLDAAIVPEICASKAPTSPIKGKANVLIFPGLEAGNIAYKLAQRLGGFEAIGPIIQGLKSPINDLSRGCSVEDIIAVAAITCVQAQAKNKI